MIELPKDANGREIPLDAECLYTPGGEKHSVLSFTYYREKDRWEIETDTLIVCSIYLYTIPPDSWEKLEEDLEMVETYEDSPNCDDPACAYARNIGKPCAECKLYGGDCAVKMCADIADRIRKLRGED